jgi:hypothetical protein
MRQHNPVRRTPPKKRAVIHHKPPLTDDQIRFIRNQRGIISAQELADMFDRTSCSIYQIWYRGTYDYVPKTEVEIAFHKRRIEQYLDRQSRIINEEGN